MCNNYTSKKSNIDHIHTQSIPFQTCNDGCWSSALFYWLKKPKETPLWSLPKYPASAGLHLQELAGQLVIWATLPKLLPRDWDKPSKRNERNKNHHLLMYAMASFSTDPIPSLQSLLPCPPFEVHLQQRSLHLVSSRSLVLQKQSD